MHEQIEELWEAVRELRERMVGMATQSDVDALATELQTVADDIGSAQTALQAELDKLEGQIASGGAVDLSNLRAIADSLDPAVQKLGQLQPGTPAPPAPAAAAALGGDVTPNPPISDAEAQAAAAAQAASSSSGEDPAQSPEAPLSQETPASPPAEPGNPGALG